MTPPQFSITPQPAPPLRRSAEAPGSSAGSALHAHRLEPSERLALGPSPVAQERGTPSRERMESERGWIRGEWRKGALARRAEERVEEEFRVEQTQDAHKPYDTTL